jgi:hypothetical protein
MLHLEISWQRVVKDEQTCERCGDTGDAVRSAAQQLAQELAPLGIAVEVVEKALDLFATPDSNLVRINGEPVETLLGATVGENHCQSCCDLLGQQTNCRTLTLGEHTFEALPEELILKAGRIAAGKLLVKELAA